MHNYKICLFPSRTTATGKNTEMSWDELKAKLSKPTITHETQSEFQGLDKSRQDEIKDVGGFVGGYLKEGKRSKLTVESRSLIVLDADFADESFRDKLKAEFGEHSFILYPTHKSCVGKRRYRVLFPLTREVTPEEYEPVARWLTSSLGIESFDLTTYQPERLMFLPSVSKDAEYDYMESDGDAIDPDLILSTAYIDWMDHTCWPRSERENKDFKKAYSRAQKASDPLTKKGIVGAFCRAYTIEEAIGEFLSEEYMPTDNPSRFTYVGGSTSGGLVLYENRFAYSHHATDPASMQLLNAFDLVRIHRFGELDEEADPKKPFKSLPSYKKMSEFASELPRVKHEIINNRPSPADDFAEELKEDPDKDWEAELEMSDKGAVLSSVRNIKLILMNHPNFKNKLAIDLMASRPVKLDFMPWDIKENLHDMFWHDSDDATLRNWLDEHYHIHARANVADALSEIFTKNAFHPVRDYFNGLEWDGTPRLETLFCRYLGAEDCAYTRAVTRKAFTACVARVMKPGCKFDYMPLLYGEQGLGKSQLLGIMGGEWFSDTLTNIGSKESYEAIDGSLIIEMGEMAAAKRADIEAIKQYISKRSDKYRRAYDRRVTDNPRQCVFFGTTNEDQCLNDYTGNRRFWVVQVTEGKQDIYKELPLERDQLWAEAVHYYKNGEQLFLDAQLEKEAREIQALHTFEPARWADIRAFIERKLPQGWKEMSFNDRIEWLTDHSYDEGEIIRETVSTKEIWLECFGGTSKNFDNQSKRDILNCLHKEGWKQDGKAIWTGKLYGTQRVFRRPEGKK